MGWVGVSIEMGYLGIKREGRPMLGARHEAAIPEREPRFTFGLLPGAGAA